MHGNDAKELQRSGGRTVERLGQRIFNDAVQREHHYPRCPLQPGGASRSSRVSVGGTGFVAVCFTMEERLRVDSSAVLTQTQI